MGGGYKQTIQYTSATGTGKIIIGLNFPSTSKPQKIKVKLEEYKDILYPVWTPSVKDITGPKGDKGSTGTSGINYTNNLVYESDAKRYCNDNKKIQIITENLETSTTYTLSFNLESPVRPEIIFEMKVAENADTYTFPIILKENNFYTCKFLTPGISFNNTVFDISIIDFAEQCSISNIKIEKGDNDNPVYTPNVRGKDNTPNLILDSNVNINGGGQPDAFKLFKNLSKKIEMKKYYTVTVWGKLYNNNFNIDIQGLDGKPTRTITEYARIRTDKYTSIIFTPFQESSISVDKQIEFFFYDNYSGTYTQVDKIKLEEDINPNPLWTECDNTYVILDFEQNQTNVVYNDEIIKSKILYAHSKGLPIIFRWNDKICFTPTITQRYGASTTILTTYSATIYFNGSNHTFEITHSSNDNSITFNI